MDKGNVKKISELKAGDRGVIKKMLVEDPLGLRLQELGVLPGTEIEVVRHAPLGGSIEIRCKGGLLLLGDEEASMIEINI